ncbi:MAG TPA: TerC family protein [Flavisolibacter sp.]|nr:TerC family protein [Flavisolibacter sp.]
MESLFTLDNLISLLTLTILEIVLSIDNVIFVSILMGRLNRNQQLNARRIWMFAGIAVRSLLLMGIGWLVNNGNKEIFNLFDHGFNLRNLIMLAGGLFLMYKSVKEIHQKLEGDADTKIITQKAVSFSSVIIQIIVVDMVFSFDSVITAVGLANKVPVMITAVTIAMILMFFFSKVISDFIQKHPTLKMLALSFLVLVGFSLFFDGLEPIHHKEIPKGYIYTSMLFAFIVEVLNMRSRKKKKAIKLYQQTPEDSNSTSQNSTRT